MQASEVAELLALASAYDNRNVTKEAAVGWKVAIDSQIPDLEVGLAREVIIDHFATSGEYFTVKHLIDGAKARLRRLPKQVMDDVRAAKARGLVEGSWPRATPLTPEVQARLDTARAVDRETAAQYAVEGPNVSTLALNVGRRP
ncbi:hypothetical protein MUN76_15220 [Leucobacter rhizosphaerae]|uniref:DUF222 domain-containing protein n=1 Tax=Leucobacter rhizosphaerae TaxID=2932245 RepID=A0ABY4FW56_9MICO|nr:hypothetical protein [Leucobacter rhizosphaerae]UOQ60359.1 hypothetical protein MUN76_15220 [Leucobacter rhizosphaerae]